jgi:hypothetical protein
MILTRVILPIAFMIMAFASDTHNALIMNAYGLLRPYAANLGQAVLNLSSILCLKVEKQIGSRPSSGISSESLTRQPGLREWFVKLFVPPAHHLV